MVRGNWKNCDANSLWVFVNRLLLKDVWPLTEEHFVIGNTSSELPIGLGGGIDRWNNSDNELSPEMFGDSNATSAYIYNYMGMDPINWGQDWYDILHPAIRTKLRWHIYNLKHNLVHRIVKQEGVGKIIGAAEFEGAQYPKSIQRLSKLASW